MRFFMLSLLGTSPVQMILLRNTVSTRRTVAVERIKVRLTLLNSVEVMLTHLHDDTELLDDPEVDVVYNPVGLPSVRYLRTTPNSLL